MSTPTAYNTSPVTAIHPTDHVFSLQRVSVRYRVPRERISGLKEYAIHWLQRRVTYEEFWALKDVSCDIRPGEVFGIIGRNGAGKSTMLKVMARVLFPTLGRVVIRGRVAPLLELGAGFHPELTGRENVYLNMALLGHSRSETDKLFPSIVDFADIFEFIDAPLRTYSTGMVARLGFSVATCVQPQILLVDEVLSVGDVPFQQKCLDRMDAFRKQGTTIIIVTHNMMTISGLCDRAMWLHQGKVEAMGDPSEVIDRYLHMDRGKDIPANQEVASVGDIYQSDSLDLDCTRLSRICDIYPTAGSFDLDQGAFSAWLRFRSDRTRRDAVIFHTDDSRYVLYAGSYYDDHLRHDMRLIVARAGGNRRVMDAALGAAVFPEASATLSESNLTVGVPYPQDEWRLVTMMWSGYPQGKVQLYIDDQIVSEKEYDSRYDDGRPLPASFAIGMRPTLWTGEVIQKSSGKVGESHPVTTLSLYDSDLEIRGIRLYRRMLSVEEIEKICSAGVQAS